MKPKKELGQNFLQDEEVVKNLIEASQPKSSDVYLEIGPGRGAVTKVLAPKVKKVIAVELDPDLIPDLKKLSAIINNIEIVNDDILKFICSNVLIHEYKINKIVGSIPYQITSPLLHSLVKLNLTSSLESTTLLIQKEVAEKILAKPPSASYLSNFVQLYFEAKSWRNVSRESFRPAPKVDGTIVRLVPRTPNYQPPTTNPVEWSNFLHAAFKFPRKMIKKVFDEKMLKASGTNPNQRPQEIELDQWQILFKIYEKPELPS